MKTMREIRNKVMNEYDIKLCNYEELLDTGDISLFNTYKIASLCEITIENVEDAYREFLKNNNVTSIVDNNCSIVKVVRSYIELEGFEEITITNPLTGEQTITTGIINYEYALQLRWA